MEKDIHNNPGLMPTGNDPESAHESSDDQLSILLSEFKSKYKEKLSDFIAERNKAGSHKLIVILDHDLGGGANLYSSLLSDSLKNIGHIVVHIKYDHKESRIKLLFNGRVYQREFTIESADSDQFKDIIATLQPSHIYINELVSWQSPLKIIKAVRELTFPFTVFIHDYFFICPSLNLINNKGCFCNIPDNLDICRKCLASNLNVDYPTYSDNAKIDIASWRNDMRSILHSAKQIICFSESSEGYIRKAFGDVKTITIAEHTIDQAEHFVWKQRSFDSNSSLAIGVIGNIGFHKGDKLIRNLMDHPDYKDLPVNIVVIGSMQSLNKDHDSDFDTLEATGVYKRQELENLLDQHNVSIVLIPSIWPETFSFTTSEAMLLGYPVICFNIGAPAERVKKYKTGIVVDDISEEGIFRAFRQILDNPYLIEEFSANGRKYAPPAAHKHFDKVLGILEGADS